MAGRQTEPDNPQANYGSRPHGGSNRPLSHGRERRNAPAFINPSSGEPIHALSHDETLGDGGGGIGDIASAIVRGDLDSLPGELRSAVTTGGDGGGNYMLAPQVSSRVVDLARSASVVMRAGAATVPMTTSELQLLRVLSDPTVSARREGAAVTASQPTFGMYTLRAKTYAALVPITIEMLEDVANAAQQIERTIRAALGLATDQAILRGAGGAEIEGIVNADGTNEETGVGTPSDYSDVSKAVGSIYQANFDGQPSELAWIHHPRDGGTYDRLVDNDGNALRPTPWAADVQRLMTTSLSPDSGNTEMIVGHFPELLVGMRTLGVVLDVIDAGSVTDDNGNTFDAVSEFYRFIRARIRIDAIMLRPDWFTVLRGVTAS